jgi:hypothetical protein
MHTRHTHRTGVAPRGSDVRLDVRFAEVARGAA